MAFDSFFLYKSDLGTKTRRDVEKIPELYFHQNFDARVLWQILKASSELSEMNFIFFCKPWAYVFFCKPCFFVNHFFCKP